MATDYCICCGKVITEGYGLTCYECNNKVREPKVDLYSEVRNKLTDFEHCTDKETTDSDWLMEFHTLLVRIQNAFELGEIVKT